MKDLNKIDMKKILWKLLAPVLLTLSLTASATTASYYGRECAGRLQANGKPFDPSRLTCASWFFPLGTKLVVSHGRQSVTVIVTDRGPAKRLVDQGRRIDLSEAAMRRLTSKPGLLDVQIKKYGKSESRKNR